VHQGWAVGQIRQCRKPVAEEAAHGRRHSWVRVRGPRAEWPPRRAVARGTLQRDGARGKARPSTYRTQGLQVQLAFAADSNNERENPRAAASRSSSTDHQVWRPPPMFPTVAAGHGRGGADTGEVQPHRPGAVTAIGTPVKGSTSRLLSRFSKYQRLHRPAAQPHPRAIMARPRSGRFLRGFHWRQVIRAMPTHRRAAFLSDAEASNPILLDAAGPGRMPARRDFAHDVGRALIDDDLVGRQRRKSWRRGRPRESTRSMMVAPRGAARCTPDLTRRLSRTR